MKLKLPLIPLLVLAASAAFGAEVSFTAKPTAARDGGPVKIRFTVSGPTDVEVAVLDANGKPIRHLAAGVLGGQTAPPPPLKAGLAQELVWDGKDDFGRPAVAGADGKVEAAPFKVRVRAGLGVKFGRFIGDDDPYTFGLVSSMVSDPDGNLYVLGAREEDSLTCATLRAFSPEGKYLRTIMPFPADLAPGAMKDVAAWDEAGQCFRPRNFRTTIVQFYTLLGGNGSGMTPSATLDVVAASKEVGILLTDGGNLYRLDGRGAVAGEKFHARRLWAAGASPRGGRPFMALSPDNKWLYVSGPYSFAKGGYKYDPRYPPGVVYRLKLDGAGPAEPFATVKVEHQDGNGGEWAKDNGDYTDYGSAGDPKGPLHDVKVDAQGRVYVADRERGRVAVFDPDGKELGHVDVRWPDQIALHPKTGALYVLEKQSFGRGKGYALKLLKFDSVKADARPSAECVIGAPTENCDKVRMAASFPNGRALFWIRTSISKGGKYALRVLEDKGGKFEPAQTDYQPKKDSQWGWGRIAVDYDRDEVYGLDGTVGLWRYDGRTGQGGMLKKDGKQFWSQDLAVGYDGLLYVRQGRGRPEYQDYSGPFARFTRDLIPAPYPSSGTHVLNPEVYGREGPGYAERGLGVGPDGKSYISFQHTFARYWLVCYGSDGKFLSGQFMEAKDKDGTSRGKATVGPLPGANGGVRVDLAGNIYVGMWLWPKSVPAPAAWANNDAYLASTGSVFKFSPQGGQVTTPAKNFISDELGDIRCTPGAKGVEARSGDRGGKNFCDAMVEGAAAAYPGFAPFSHANWGSNLCCVCRTPRFDLDRYGRLYIPNAITNSVRVVDNAGNQIVEFGRYGNFDSGYVNPNTAAGQAGKPTVAVPDVPLGWPTGAGVSEDHIYVCDTYNRRGVRADPTWKAEELCEVK